MTKEEMDFIGAMNMCDEISNEAYKKIVCKCEEQEPCEKHDSDYWINLLNLFQDDPGHICECQNARTEILNALLDKPCEDAISRQAVLKQLKGCLTGGDTEYKYVKLHIESILPVSPARSIGRWIPVSERLPEKEGWYLACTEGSVISVLRYCEGWNCYGTPGVYIFRDYEMFDVVAWMSLPEPYHEDCKVGGD